MHGTILNSKEYDKFIDISLEKLRNPVFRQKLFQKIWEIKNPEDYNFIICLKIKKISCKKEKEVLVVKAFKIIDDKRHLYFFESEHPCSPKEFKKIKFSFIGKLMRTDGKRIQKFNCQDEVWITIKGKPKLSWEIFGLRVKNFFKTFSSCTLL